MAEQKADAGFMEFDDLIIYGKTDIGDLEPEEYESREDFLDDIARSDDFYLDRDQDLKIDEPINTSSTARLNQETQAGEPWDDETSYGTVRPSNLNNLTG